MSNNNKNTWSHSDKVRATIAKNDPRSSDPNFVLDNMYIMEETWQSICTENSFHEVIKSERDTDLFRYSFGSPFEYLINCIAVGVYPPPEIMVTIWRCYQQYLSKNGSVSLEECFFGREVPAVGNHSARNKRDWRYNHLNVLHELSKRNLRQTGQNGKTLLSLAEEMVNDQEDPESFLRGFRRWKKRNTDN